MSQSNFNIINAAAGSGKTYTLVLYYLKQLLGAKKPRPYRQMLALTFTNKAVNEMKVRILEALHDLSKTPSQNIELQEQLSQDLEIKIDELTRRAETMLRNIVLEYGSFDVITLDKFTHRIVRTFAKEFELPKGFEVVLDSKSILDQVVQSIIDQIGKDELITQLLLELSLSKIRQGMSWDIQSDLDDFAALLLNENDRIPLADLRKKDRQTHKKDQEQLKNSLKQTKERIKNKTSEFIQLLREKDLVPEDFTRQILFKHLDLLHQEFYEKLYGNQLEAMLKGLVPLYKKSTEASKKQMIDQLLPQFLSLFLSIKKEVGFYLLIEKTLKYWTPRLILQQIEQGLKVLQNEREIRLLGEFNQKISSLVQVEEAPYIYARLGERYNHYYLDEFQDTSSLQWSNLLPLIGSALESESLSGEQGSLVLVGDPKQAIYRWRGGDIMQFIQLLKKKSKPFQIVPLIKRLEVNYRSDASIVSFNNSFFSYLTTVLVSPEIQSIYGEESQQQVKNPGGFVQIKAIPQGGNQEDKIPLYVAETISAIKQAMEHKFEQKEIAVLVRVKKQSVVISENLIAQGYDILSSDSLAVGNSSQVQTILAVLKLLIRPNSTTQHKIIFDEFWKFEGIIQGDYHRIVSNLIHLQTFEFFNQLNKISSSTYNPKELRGLSLIETIDFIIASFPILDFNNPFILTFLEDVFEFSRQKGVSLSEYLSHWETQSEKLRLSTPEHTNAIRVMTIHQAKGLEFPIVILPFMDTQLHPNVRDKIWFSFQNSTLANIQWGWFNFSSQLLHCGSDAEALYKEHLLAKELDALNILYVALTRARNQLYVVTHSVNEEGTKTYADLFGSYVRSQGKRLDENSHFELGDPELAKLNRKDLNEDNELQLYVGISNKWKENLIVPTSPSNEVLISQEKGLLIHELLAKIKNKEMFTEVMEEGINSKILSELEMLELKKTANQIIMHPELKEYFEGTDQVLCEQEILIPNGPTLRPDRINISQHGRATILDYKTGSPKAKDKKQVEVYAEAITALGFNHVVSKLVYIDKEIDVISVGQIIR